MRSFFWLHGYNKVSNAGRPSDTHSLLSAASIDVTQSWAPAPPFTREQPETFEYGQEIGVIWLHISIMPPYFTPRSREGARHTCLPFPPSPGIWLATGYWLIPRAPQCFIHSFNNCSDTFLKMVLRSLKASSEQPKSKNSNIHISKSVNNKKACNRGKYKN